MLNRILQDAMQEYITDPISDDDTLIRTFEEHASVEDTNAALRYALDSKEWFLFSALASFVMENPHPDYAPVLAEGMRRANSKLHYEDITEAIGECKNPVAIPTLVWAIWRDWTNDPDHRVAEKCLFSLNQIATSEAMLAIRDVAERTSSAKVRSYAEPYL